MVSERVNSARDLRGDYSGSAEERLTAWQVEMEEILKVFDVRDFQPTTPTVSKLPQGDLGRDGALEVGTGTQANDRTFVYICLSPAKRCPRPGREIKKS